MTPRIVEIRKKISELSDIITVENIPDDKEESCKITINLPWDVAHRLAEIAAPFLRALSITTENNKTRYEQERELKKEEDSIRYAIRKSRDRSEFRNILKGIHREGITFGEFYRRIDKGCFLGLPCGFGKWQLRGIYYRFRHWSIMRRVEQGWSQERILEFYELKRTAFSTIKNKTRKEMKELSHQTNHKTKFIRGNSQLARMKKAGII